MKRYNTNPKTLLTDGLFVMSFIFLILIVVSYVKENGWTGFAWVVIACMAITFWLAGLSMVITNLIFKGFDMLESWLFPGEPIDLTAPQGLSHFRWDESVHYGRNGDDLYGGNEIEWGRRTAQTLRIKYHDRKNREGLIREWYFEAFMFNPRTNVHTTLSEPKGKATIYKVKRDTILKCVALPHERGKGFITYKEIPIGHIEPWPEAKYDQVIITDYS